MYKFNVKKEFIIILVLILTFMSFPVNFVGAEASTQSSIVIEYKPVKAIHASTNIHSLAVLEDGTIQAWGNNWSGQLGDYTMTNGGYPADSLLSSIFILTKRLTAIFPMILKKEIR
ncbi:hypothetical protein [Ferviditalea candida]|uniref:hypothetical protein n=1 Tax=Ferviditalea candida TaxID=3108399 RepID=UPI00352D1DCC